MLPCKSLVHLLRRIMATNYTLNYTNADGFTLNAEEISEKTPFVRLILDFDDSPSPESLETLADVIKNVEPNGKDGLLLDCFYLCLGEGEKVGTMKQLGKDEEAYELPVLDSQSVQAFMAKLMSVLPEGFTQFHVEDIDGINSEAMIPFLAGLPETATHLNLAACNLDEVDQLKFNQALASKKLKVISLASALDDYSEEKLLNLVTALPETLEEVVLHDNGEEDNDWKMGQLLAKLRPAINVKKIKVAQPSENTSESKWVTAGNLLSGLATTLKNGFLYLANVGQPGMGELLEEMGNSHKVAAVKKSPVEEAAKTSPVQEAAKTSPVQEEAKTSPVQEEVKKSPVQEEVKKSPVQEEVKKSPVQEEVKKSPVELEDLLASPTKNTVEQPPVSSSFLLGFFQVMKHVSIALAALVIGGLVGTAVGLAVSAVATPAAGIAAGLVAGTGAAALTVPTLYSFFPSAPSKAAKDEEEENDFGFTKI